jgi:Na+-translocating ferredoxin:NAD+ oxidoreductase RnfG subunit
MKRRRFIGGIAAALAGPAFATEYLSADAALRVIFPDATQFVPVDVSAGAARLRVPPARLARLRAFEARKDGERTGYVVMDEVIGKFELIGFAVGLTPAFAVKQVEILAYRESHGYEIRQAAWRAQFVGKGPSAPLKVGDDIQNISGATLSCTHVTDGVHLIVALASAAFGT